MYYTKISWSRDYFLIWIFYLGPNLSDDTVGIESISRMSEHNPLLCNRPKMHLRTELCSYSQCLMTHRPVLQKLSTDVHKYLILSMLREELISILWQERQKWSNDSDTTHPHPLKKEEKAIFFNSQFILQTWHFLLF